MNTNIREASYLAGWAIVVSVLYWTSLYSYLLFHSLAELFSIVVAFGVFIIAWNARQFLQNNYLLFLGVASAFVAFLDTIHTLAFKGMGVFPGFDANLPTQLWIIARYMESVSFLVAPIFLTRRLKVSAVLAVYLLCTGFALLTLFWWPIFPACYIEGVGLTPFKKVSEYVISLILAAATFALLARRSAFDPRVLRLLVLSIGVTVGSELAFTAYLSVYGFANFLGHIGKIVSFSLIYLAVIRTGLREPYALLFRDLKQSEEAIERARKGLEVRVHERTVELAQANEELRAEIAVRRRAEEALRRAHDELELRVKERTAELAQANDVLQKEIAERKRAQEEIERLTVQLLQRLVEVREANQELESFSYSVSHDLRAPLRALQGFSRILLDEHVRNLDPEARHFVQRIQESAHEMNELVNALLTLSRIGRQAPKRVPFVPAECVGQCLAELRREHEGRRVEIVTGDLPACLGDPTLLKQVWINLLSNAIKFTRQREVARIEIGSLTNAECGVRNAECTGEGIDSQPAIVDHKSAIYFVRDNGAGFDMRYAHKLFSVFQRLHRSEDYEGTGVGLAIVQRIIHRHGGQVWAEAEVDKGATFYFTLGDDATGRGRQ